MDIILIAGLWLKRTTWNAVVDELEQAGHRVKALALPGADDGSTDATLEDQVSAALAAVDELANPIVVGHSAACTVAWMVADRRPTAIDRVVLIGGFPASDGETYAAFFEAVDGLMPFPGWGPFEGADSADLDEPARSRIESDMVPVPEGVSTATVRLSDDRRFDVPTVVVCPEFSVEQARGWVADGEAPELSAVKTIAYVDIDSGHWPMETQPAELARLITAAPDYD